MFGLGPATRIYLGVESVDIRNYAPSIDMRSLPEPLRARSLHCFIASHETGTSNST